MKQPVKCDDCVKNWQNMHKIAYQELMTATEDCRTCTRNNYRLYTKLSENENKHSEVNF